MEGLGTPPKDQRSGLREAIENTKDTIHDYGVAGFDTSELRVHLEGLENKLRKEEEEMAKEGKKS